MGLFDRALGRPSEGETPQSAGASSPTDERIASSSSSSTSSSGSPPNLDLLRDISPESTLLKTVSMKVETPTGRLYNPYEGLSASVGAKPHAFRLPQGPEFVFEEEAAVRRRGWTENLQFYTGLGYLSGGSVGVAAGLYRYVTIKPDIVTDTLKLKTNRLLNTTGSFARPFSNSCGILGLFFSASESIFLSNLEQHGVPDTACTTLAGFVSGAMFRLPRGPRQMLAAGVVGAAAGAGILTLRKTFPSM